MPTRKKSQSAKKIQTGPVPPYGIAIQQAIARGDSQEMRKVAASARKYLKDLQAASEKLDKAMSKSGS
jgi:Domain of unknown function (DUF1843)